MTRSKSRFEVKFIHNVILLDENSTFLSLLMARKDRIRWIISQLFKFLLQVVKSIAIAISSDKFGRRISPAIEHLDAIDSDPCALGLALNNNCINFNLN